MATSGTNTFNLDITEIMEEAFDLCGLDLRSGGDYNTAKRALDLIFLEWQNKGLNLWKVEQGSMTLTAGANLYDADASALEIVDDRHSADKSNFEYLVAQNSMNHGCVLGEPETIDLLTLDQLEGDLIVSGEVFGSGKGKNVLHHPLNSVLYLVNNLIKRGRNLYAGDIVLTGSISTTCWPKSGDKVEAHIEKLNSVSMNIF